MTASTSREAYASVVNDLGAMRAKVYRALHRKPRTDEELIRLTGLSPNSCRPRRVELVEMGLVQDSGQRKQTRSGRWAIVWMVAR